MSSGSHLSKELLDLVKSIGESRSKQEEDKIITAEAQLLKSKFTERNMPEKKMRELLIRAIYVEMLGHDASFSYIHAVNLTQSKNLLVKKIGYLACSLFIDENSEMLILMIATVQKDLQSKNHMEVLAALTVLTKLQNMHMSMAVNDAVTALLAHNNEMVRKKAVMVIIKLNKIHPQPDFDLTMKRALCDKDPSVMAAALNYFHEEVKKRPADFKDLTNSFVVILRQIIEHRLPRDFDYHRMPAPWIQAKILEVLSILGADDQKISEQLYDILTTVLKKADDTGINIGYALVYQCLLTITTICPNQALIDLASQTISRFLSSESHNLKYIGINGLASIVKIDPKYTLSYQSLVVDCLEDTDDTLKIKTLDLLYKMTNSQNVEPIVDKLLQYLKEAPIEASSRKDLVFKISSLGEKFSPSQNWYVKTMNKLFEIGGDHITNELTNKFIQSISEYEQREDGVKFRDSTIKIYLKILKKNPNIPDSLMQVIAWILGEYGGRLDDQGKILKILDLLSQFSYGTYEDERTRGFILTAITKLHMSLNFTPNKYVEQVMNDYFTSKDIDVQQRAFEYSVLKEKHTSLPNSGKDLIFNIPLTDSAIEAQNFDFNLGFLDDFVQQQLNEGKPAYDKSKAQVSLDGLIQENIEKSLNFTPYSQANTGVTSNSSSLQQSNPLFTQQQLQQQDTKQGAQLATTNVRKVWGENMAPQAADQNAQQQNVQQHVDSHYSSSNNLKTTTTPSVAPTLNPSTNVWGSNNTSSANAPQVHKEETYEDKKKAKMANALFSGIADESEDGEKKKKKKKKDKKEDAQEDSNQVQQDVDSLIDTGSSNTQPQTTQNTQNNVMDLLDFNQNNQQQQPAATSQNQGGNLLDDILSGSTQQPQQPVITQPPFTPLQINTGQFGGNWGVNSIEKKLSVHCPQINQPQIYSDVTSSTLGFFKVEIINNEVISAANGSSGNQILMHCQVNTDGKLNFTVRSSQQNDVDRLINELIPNMCNSRAQSLF